MKKEFKVGDRVAVKYVSAVGIPCKEKATVTLINQHGALVLEKDVLPGEYSDHHPDNCRRLVKKKRREFDLHFDHGKCEVVLASDKAWIGNTEVIRVREVKRK
jgi:hypothetical protein